MKIVKKEKRRIVLKIVSALLMMAVFVVAAISNNFIPRDFADYYCTNIFPYISVPFQRFSMIFHFSLTENLIVCLAPMLAAGLVIWLVILIKKLMTKGAGIYLYRSYRNLMIVLIAGAVLFQAMHGFNYRRTHVSKELELNTEDELTYEDYLEALKWAYSGMIEARSHLGEDYNGVAHMRGSFENSAAYACSLLNAFSDKYDIPLSRNYVRAKPVSLSHYWSYTYIVGVYDPFLGEANINTDYLNITEYPITICHELCHTKGYASETDCNLLAALACCSSSRADFRYCGFYEIFWNLYSTTAGIAKATNEVMPQYELTSEMEPVYRDMRAANLYWLNIDREVDDIYEIFGIDITEASSTANDTFLKSNGESGVDSYVVPESIYVRFYLTHVAGVEDA